MPPSDPAALLAAAVDAHRRGDLAAALDGYRRILAADPRHFDALHLLGVLSRQRGDPTASADLVARAIAIRPDVAAAHTHMGLALRDLGRHDEALASLRHAVALDGRHASAWNNLGTVLHERGEADEALACADRAIALDGGVAEFHANRANALRALGRLDDALAECDRAIALSPGLAHAWRNRAVVLRALGLPGAAVASAEAAIAREPDSADAHLSRGIALADLRDTDGAIEAIDRAIALAPEHADAHWALALTSLLAGDLARGFESFEWRWRTAQGRPFAREFGVPAWDGAASLDGRTILLHAEQGLGDTLQFVRYAPLVRARGARVLLEAPVPLAALLARQPFADRVITRGQPLPAFDLHCPLMSLPRAFGTTLETVPAPPRYLEPDPERVAAWRVRLGPSTRPRVGIAWSGAPTRPGAAERSVPLAAFAALLDARVEWVGLQHEVRAADRGVLASRPEIRWVGDPLRDVDELAALVDALDAVVCIDTAIAHLAGALGRPTWVLLAAAADWRWLLERDDSPWYAAMTLVRQARAGDWGDVLHRAREGLHGHLDGHRPGRAG